MISVLNRLKNIALNLKLAFYQSGFGSARVSLSSDKSKAQTTYGRKFKNAYNLAIVLMRDDPQKNKFFCRTTIIQILSPIAALQMALREGQ